MTKYKNKITSDLQLDQKIYRIISVEYLLDAIDTDKSYFSWPGKWRDPYDSVFMKVPCKIGNNQVDHGYEREYFCQCWCKSESESDAMWRLYSENSEGVMICSTVQNVFDSIFDDTNELSIVNTYCGSVTYKPMCEFNDKLFFYNNVGPSSNVWESSGRGLASTLLYKVDAYNHEDEVRFIVSDKDRACYCHKMVKHKPNFLDIINAIVFDPEATCDFMDSVLCSLEKRGKKIATKKSDLYHLKPVIYEFHT